MSVVKQCGNMTLDRPGEWQTTTLAMQNRSVASSKWQLALCVQHWTLSMLPVQ